MLASKLARLDPEQRPRERGELCHLDTTALHRQPVRRLRPQLRARGARVHQRQRLTRADVNVCRACARAERARADGGVRGVLESYCFTGGALSDSGSKSSSSLGHTGQPASMGTEVVAGNLAANVGTSSGTAGLSPLERNSNIIMGLPDGAIVLLVVAVVMPVQSRQATRGYTPIREERMVERKHHRERNGEYQD